MAEVTYTSVSWTSGDTITEAKLDNMVANDRAVDAMNNGVRFDERSNPADADVPSDTLFLYAKDNGGTSALYAKDDGNTVYRLPENRPGFGFSIPGSASATNNITPPLLAMRSQTIVKAYAYAITAPSGADLIFDINKGGTSIWSSTQANRITISDGNNLGTQTSFDTTSLADEDVLTLDCDQVGSSTAGSKIIVQLRTKVT